MSHARSESSTTPTRHLAAVKFAARRTWLEGRTAAEAVRVTQAVLEVAVQYLGSVQIGEGSHASQVRADVGPLLLADGLHLLLARGAWTGGTVGRGQVMSALIRAGHLLAPDNLDDAFGPWSASELFITQNHRKLPRPTADASPWPGRILLVQLYAVRCSNAGPFANIFLTFMIHDAS
eukprot:COSAG01_NODE_2601_length_7394_cov_42.287868_1_plen_178_part_00